MKAYEIRIDENRSVMGRELRDKDAVLFRIVNGACVTQIALTHEAIEAMLCIAVEIKKASKTKGGKGMNKPRNKNGQFTSPETERRRAWAAMRVTGDRLHMLPIGSMTFVEHLGRLQAIAEGRVGNA